MLRNKLIYAALLVIMVLFLILYRGTLSLELFLFTIALPCILRILLWILRLSLRIRLLRNEEEPICGKPFSAVTEIRNRSLLSVSCAQLKLKYYSILCGNPQEGTIQIPILACNTQKISYGFRTYICGDIRFCAEMLTIYDPLRLFRSKIPLHLEESFCIMPELLELPEAFWEKLLSANQDADAFSQDKPGDDPSEIYDFHEYHFGDSVSRIHWKLSSKRDMIFVKEYSLPSVGSFLLFADYTHTTDLPESGIRLHTMLSVCRSVAYALCTNQRICVCASWDRSVESIAAVTEDAPAMCDAWLRELLGNSPCASVERTLIFSALSEYLTESSRFSHIFLCLPLLDEEIAAWITTLPYAERITVLAVSGPQEEPLEQEALPCSVIWIPWIDHRADSESGASESFGHSETEVKLS